jgi:hypothetical protein
MWGDAQALLGRELGHARWGWLGRAAGLRGLLLPFFFSFLFFISFPLFKFNFGLEFEFTTEVTCSLEFREFCFIINFIELLSIT